MQYVMLLITGFALGAANIVPGISGATLAVIFRMYDRLIESINELFSNVKKSLLFLVPVGIGMLAGILVVGTVMDGFLDRFAFQTSALIAGLVAGGIPFIHSQAISKEGRKPVFYVIAAFAAAIIIALALVVPTPAVYAYGEFSFSFAVLLFVGGMVAAAAMIVPGVSGAMMLMMFGLLTVVMNTISLITEYLRTPFDFGLLGPILQVVLPLGLGMVAGILLASKLIAFLLARFFTITYFVILGLVIGTIFAVFSDSRTYENIDVMTVPLVVIGVLVFIVGMVIALLLGKPKEDVKPPQ